MRNLFNSKSEDQPPVPHNEVPSVAHSETPVEPTAPKKKSVKPKQSTVAVARVPKEEASAAPQGRPKARLLRSVARHRSLLREASITASALAVKQTS
jgi:hypothetical protein